MKNFVIAIVGLIIVLVAVFVFTAKHKFGTSDLVIPSQVPLQPETPKLMFNNESSSQAATLPFPLQAAQQIESTKVTIETDKGNVAIHLFGDAPIAASNFIYLANKKFYDGLIFHRVIKGFMIQGGDPKGNGTGGPGYKFKDELDPTSASYKKGYVRGILAMANSGPNTNGSQFFIMHQDNQLPHNYTIFGEVISGMDVVDLIASSEVDGNDKPIQQVTMTKIIVE
jgi:cyclophilin family peptidyl-prolyl cis-trans isomerase